MDSRADSRGQSTLVGFILLFGILTIAFSSYQAVVVPNQNAEVEFNHFQDIQNDFTEFRSTLVNSVGSNEERAVTFRLGTQYPARLLALNPPPVSGQLETIEDGNRTVVINSTSGENIATNVCGADSAPTTNSLRYTPNYNEYGSPRAVLYENRFVAREFRDGNVYDEQRLIDESSGEIRLLLLNGSVSRASQESYSFDINASRRNRTAESRTVSNITIPSQYNGTEWENTILNDMEVNATKQGDGRVQIKGKNNSTLGNYSVSCAVAGLNQAPEFGPSVEETTRVRDGINLQDIRLNGVKSLDKQSGKVELSFTNSNSNSTSIEEARINFYQTGNPGQNRDIPDSANISDTENGDSETLTVGGGFEPTPQIPFAANAESTVWLDFDKKIENRDWFVLTVQFDGVGTRQYFVSLRDEANNNGGGGGGNGGASGQPSVTVDNVVYNKDDSEVTVEFTPNDPDENLDTADIIIEDKNDNQDASRQVDVTNQEGTQITETFSGLNNGGTPYTATVTVTDTDDNTASDSGTS